MSPERGYKTQTINTLIMGLAAMLEIFLLSLFLHWSQSRFRKNRPDFTWFSEDFGKYRDFWILFRKRGGKRDCFL